MLVESSALHAQSVPEVEGGQAKVRSSTNEQRAAVGLVWTGCALVLLQRDLRVDEQQRKGWTVENDTKQHQTTPTRAPRRSHVEIDCSIDLSSSLAAASCTWLEGDETGALRRQRNHRLLLQWCHPSPK